MSRFYGRMTGGRGEVTRTGTKNSEITSTLSSTGDVFVTTILDETKDGTEHIRVTMIIRGRRITIGEWMVDLAGNLREIDLYARKGSVHQGVDCPRPDPYWRKI